mmetsp:Transcript_26192/g.73283  ORF Transcript_26192/g.73283 Transcript_26192/m.73283 type:complete len:705 (+) Transcript_26192:56-2170(+)
MASCGTHDLSFFDLLRRLGEAHEKQLEAARLGGHPAPARPEPLVPAAGGISSHPPDVDCSDDEVFSERVPVQLLSARSFQKSSMNKAISRSRSVELRLRPEHSTNSLDTLPRVLRRVVTSDEVTLNFSEKAGSDSFELHAHWLSTKRRPSVVASLLNQDSGASRPIEATPSPLIETPLRCLYISPVSTGRTAWDVMSIVILMYDVVMIPMATFDLPASQFTSTMSLVVTLFWTVDVVSNLLVGYYHKGVLIMRPGDIAKHYLQGWFAFDATALCLDWFLLILVGADPTASGIIRLIRSSRIARLLKSLRLLRLIKMQQLSASLNELFYSEGANAVYSVTKHFLCILVLTHVVACGWYAVGTFRNADGPWTWVGNAGLPTRSVEYCYSTSLYWTLVQLGFGSTSIEPTNFAERVFAIVVLFLGIVVFSSVVGMLTNVLADLRTMREHESKQMRLLHRFCTQNMISKGLRCRVVHFMEYEFAQRGLRLDDKDVEIFELLSKPLYAEIQYERYVPCLRNHSLFKRWLRIRTPTTSYCTRPGLGNIVQRICSTAIVRISLGDGDVLFCFGDVADRAYVVGGGTLEYVQRSHLAAVETGGWVSEAVLWVPWVHVGELKSKTPSQVLFLETAALKSVIGAHYEAWLVAVRYAKRFLELLDALTEDQLSDLVEGTTISFDEGKDQQVRALRHGWFRRARPRSSDSLSSSLS